MSIVSRSYVHYASALLLLLTVVVLISLMLYRHQASELVLSDYYSYQCQSLQPQADKPVFSILTVASQHAADIADQLCQSATVSRLYRGVSIRWQRRDYLTLDQIQNTRFDLFFNRAHVVEGIAPNLDLYYRLFRESPHYSLYWLSLTTQPDMSQEYFSDKTIGLLADPHSQSFHIQPLDSLNEAAIELRADQIIYFSDMTSLYSALTNGTVDLMSTPKGLIKNTFDEHKARYLLISDHMSPGSWYLNNNVSASLYCDLQQALDIYYVGMFPNAEPTQCE